MRPGINILCIDGGGMRGLSSLLLVSEIMNRLAEIEGARGGRNMKPSDYFDVIAGTGTGGVSACMLGRLRMPVDRAIQAYVKLVKEVFSDKEAVWTSGSNTYKRSKLQEALKSMVQDATGNQDERMEVQVEEQPCKTMVFAMPKHNMNASIPTMFRSYGVTVNPAPNCAIWEALYATMAHPDLFKSIDISDGVIQQSFVGGELGCSNPIVQVLAEVRRLYPNRHVSCILSIGAGHPRTICLSDPSPYQCLPGVAEVTAMKDMATDSERVAEQMAARFQDTTGAYYRLNVDQGMQNMNAGDWEKLGEAATHTRAYIGKVEPNRKIDQAVRAIKARNATISVECIDGRIQVPLGAGEQTITLKRCPAPTSVFTGRDDLIQQVGNCIAGGTNERRVCVVRGLGGAGKTQLALKTIERNRDNWTYVLYVDASSSEAIESTLGAFARAKDTGRTHDDALSWLERCHEPWLLVFDNADHPSLNIHRYFPAGNRGSILITTRLANLNQHARGPGSDCHVSSMSHEDALALLLRLAQIQGPVVAQGELEAANALLKDFGNLALAIVHAGAYIGHSPHMTISKYRGLFLSQRRSMLERYGKLKVKVDDYQQSVFTTWKMCYDLLEEGGNSRPLLWLMAFMHHDGITEELFRRAATNIRSYKPELPMTEVEKTARRYVRKYLGRFLDNNTRLWDTALFSDAISELASYSLIDFDRVNLAYSVHVLVQEWVRTVISEERNLALECTTTLIAQSVDQDDTAEAHMSRRKLVLHVGKIRSEHQTEVSANHAFRFSMVYESNGQWGQKEALDVHVSEARERVLGKEHIDTLYSMGSLACTYSDQGRFREAESLLVETMRIIGENDPRALVTIDNRARAKQRQGQSTKAARLQLRVLNAFILGERQVFTLVILSNLACAYARQGQLDEAELLQVQVLDISKKARGEEHPDTLAFMHVLACIFSHQNRQDQAERLFTQTVDARKRILGTEHPSTLESMLSLSFTYTHQDRWEEAELLQVQVLDAHKRIFGEEHPDTLVSMSSLAYTYATRNRNRRDEAELLQVQVLDARKRILGEEHPDTLKSMRSLAFLYIRRRRWEDAELLQVRVLDARKRILGEEHPITLVSMHDLAFLYIRWGRWEDSELLQVRVLDARKRILGEEHPSTLVSMRELACTYAKHDLWDEAESLYMQVLGASKEILRNRSNKTKSLLSQVVEVLGIRMGDRHPRTLSVRDDIDLIRARLQRKSGSR